MEQNCLLTFFLTLAVYSDVKAGIIKDYKTNNIILRVPRNVAVTDPNNIRVTVGTMQTHPAPEVSNGGYAQVDDTLLRTEEYVHPSFIGFNDETNHAVHQEKLHTEDLRIIKDFAVSPVNIIVDTKNNDPGDEEHRNNVIIGGIQNFSGRSDEDILKSLQVDVNNMGGIHQNTVTIGGMLIF